MTKKELAAAMKRVAIGDTEAMVMAGAHFYTREQYDKAAELYEMAAKGGDIQAMINLGYCHYYGRLGNVDYAESYHWFSKAVVMAGLERDMNDYPEAYFKLGDHYRYGHFVKADPRMAFTLYDHAYRSAHAYDEVIDTEERLSNIGLLVADTAFRMGECYRDGIGVDKDIGQALAYFIKSEIAFARKVRLGDKFAPGLLAKARKAVDDVIDVFKEDRHV